MYKLYIFLEYITGNKSSKFEKFLYYKLLIPISLLLEYIIYLFFWKKIIISELLTSDEIVAFLDKNEFAYQGNKLMKIDLLSSNEYWNRISLEESKHIIKKEFVDALSGLISTNISTNIEEYITLIVETEVQSVKYSGENYIGKVFSVKIQFCRLYYLQKLKKNFIIYMLISILILVFAYFLPIIFHLIK